MASRIFGRVTITTPDLEEPGLYLSKVANLHTPRGRIQDFLYGGADLRSLELTNTQLIAGRISEVRSRAARFTALDIHGVEITGSDLGAVHWAAGRLTRVHLRDCKLLGARLDDLVLDDVLFEECRFDLATFSKARARGPVVFARCVLAEATFIDCDLSDAVFSECALRRTEFGAGRYRNMDLRGSDLSELRGPGNLRGVRIDQGQQAELAEALVTELGVTFGGD
ncbi:pentapeptide repeat-containing protein [Streptomyces sp. URMC 126]|uniref:pentapeptide repeat-containing protein n=1 Tax=Streptomyces sp. URMC 126 TaxID=3423401 RepID=UPI003F194580